MINQPTAEDELPASRGSQEAEEHAGGPGGSTAEVYYYPHTDTLCLAGDDTTAHRDGPAAMIQTPSGRNRYASWLAVAAGLHSGRQGQTKPTVGMVSRLLSAPMSALTIYSGG